MRITKRNIIEIAFLVVFAAWMTDIVYFAVRIFLFDQFIIPTGSMIPTLLPGDRIIVDKRIAGARLYDKFDFDQNGVELLSHRTRGQRKVEPNDIVVFNYPHHGGKINFVINHVYAKRCVGVPGDTVSIVGGVFRNNNHPGPIGLLHTQRLLGELPDSMMLPRILGAMPQTRRVPWTIKNLGPLYLPRPGDVMVLSAKEGQVYKMILEWETGKEITVDWDNNRVLADGEPLSAHTFKHGYYFMCGDNVGNSSDSRYWGPVPEEYIVGVVTHVFYSIDPKTGKYRKDRILKNINQKYEV